MKKRLLPIFAMLFSWSLMAQNPSCDGSRYIDPVFASTVKTTVQYAVAPSYFPNQTVALSMDIYEPEGDQAALRPALILAHGGSFIFGDKADMQGFCEDAAKKGYVAISIQYRLYPVLVLGWPDSADVMDAAMKAVGDMKAGVRFLRQDAATNNNYRIDTEHIFIGGVSAGAITALHAAYLDSDDDIPPFLQTILDANGGLEGNTGDAANWSYDSHASAVLNMSGGLYRASWLDTGEVPLSSMHGTADNTVYYYTGLAAGLAYLEGSGVIHPEAETKGIWQNLVTVEGGGHTDIYTELAYLPDLNNYIQISTELLESLTCASSSSKELFANAKPLKLFPNPANSTVVLELPESWQETQVRVLDMQGKLLYEQMHTGSQFNVPTNQWSNGNYIVQALRLDGNPEIRISKLSVAH
jgi:poly(3-hydroxybutyrate) depolymerase